jgi:DNA-binding MarR family transcriptional regulator
MSTTVPPTLAALTVYLLSKTGKAARGAMARELADEDLRLTHMAALAALADFGPLVQRDLAARLGMDPSDTVKVVDDLTAAGWAERTRDTADRRRVRVALTDWGRTTLRRLTGLAEEVQHDLLAPLTPDQRAQFHALLVLVHDGLRPAVPGPERGAS